MNPGGLLLGLLVLSAQKKTAGQETLSSGEGVLMTLGLIWLGAEYLHRKVPKS